jgi:hypothetical protein
MYANVFPLPVSACRIQDKPVVNGDIDFFCIGVGMVIPILFKEVDITSGKLTRANDTGVLSTSFVVVEDIDV